MTNNGNTDKGRPFCKVIGHWKPDYNMVIVNFEDSVLQSNDFCYVAIRRKGQELLPGKNEYTAFLDPVFFDNIFE